MAAKSEPEQKIDLDAFFKPKPLFGDDKDLGVIIQKLTDDDFKANKQLNKKDSKTKSESKNDNDSDDEDECEQEACIIDDNGNVTHQDYSLSKKDFKDWSINKIIKKSNFHILLKNKDKKLDENTQFWMFIKKLYPGAYTAIKARAHTKVQFMIKNESHLIQNMSFDEISAIYLYTTNYVYRALNASLRSRNAKWAKFCGPFLSGISKLPFEWKPLYRGVKHNEVVERIHKYYEKDVVLRWDSFSSTSTDYETAKRFAGKTGGIFEVENGYRGRDIAKFSEYPCESEVLFNLSSHFLVTNKYQKEKDKRIYIRCKEIPFPWDAKTILWVDDQPKGNKKLIEKFERQGIMIIPRISTFGAIEFLKFMSDAININTFSKFRVITDMGRIEYENDDITNEKSKTKDKQAGITLIHALRKHGYKNICCIYTWNKDKAIEKCKARGVYDKNKVIVTVTEQEVEKYASFE